MKNLIKSFTDLSKLNRRELFRPISEKNRDLRLISLDKKFAVSIARIIADDFKGVDLRKPISNYNYKKARKYITEYYEASRSKNLEIIRPTKKNREIYAKRTGLSSKLRYYPVTKSGENTTLKIINGKLKELGKFVNYDRYYFDIEDLIDDTEKEVKNVYKKIEKDYPNRLKEIKIICGNYVSGWTKEKAKDTLEVLTEEIERYMNTYASWGLWMHGVEVQVFVNQQLRGKRK